jgi:hypothetical protein
MHHTGFDFSVLCPQKLFHWRVEVLIKGEHLDFLWFVSEGNIRRGKRVGTAALLIPISSLWFGGADCPLLVEIKNCVEGLFKGCIPLKIQ